MKTTYTRTFFIEDLTKATITLYVHTECKYKLSDENEDKETEVKYTGVKAWDIIEGGKEAEEIEKDGLIDENHEYLVLHFENGETATFRNSYVDMFLR